MLKQSAIRSLSERDLLHSLSDKLSAPIDVMASREQGNRAFKAGRFAEAVTHYTSAIAECGDSDSKHLLHGNRF